MKRKNQEQFVPLVRFGAKMCIDLIITLTTEI